MMVFYSCFVPEATVKYHGPAEHLANSTTFRWRFSAHLGYDTARCAALGTLLFDYEFFTAPLGRFFFLFCFVLFFCWGSVPRHLFCAM